MSFLWTPEAAEFTDGPITGYGYWAVSSSALTAVPSASQQLYGWQSNDVVTAASMNWLMRQSQSVFQAFLQNGLFSQAKNSEQYGDGRDGNVTISSTTTLSRDMFYDTLTIYGSGSIDTAGYRIYAQTLAISAAGVGAIKFNGADGSNGAYGTGGAGGAAVVGSFASISGDSGSNSYQDLPVSPVTAVDQRTVFASYVKERRKGGDGGVFYYVSSNAAGAAGSYNYTNEVQWVPAADPWANCWRGKVISGGVGGGGGGGGGGSETYALGPGGGGGGGGASGGFVFIAAKNIVASTGTAAGAIQALGGDGGDGGNGESSGNGGGGGGGGAGGSGGTVVIICDAIFDADTVDGTSTGFADVIDVSGGDGGAGGNGTVGGSSQGQPGDGGDGGNGGVVMILQNGLREDDPRRIVWAPATGSGLGASGTRAPDSGPYVVIGGVQQNLHNYAGGAGGIWKVAL